MIEVLLVEDDPYKEKGLREAMLEILHEPKTALATSVQTAVTAIRLRSYKLVVLDMALPSHDRSLGNGNPRQMPSGGLEVLLNLNEKKRPDAVIIVTQYPEIEINNQLVPIDQVPIFLSAFLDVQLKGVIFYDEFDPGWRKEFQTILRGCFA